MTMSWNSAKARLWWRCRRMRSTADFGELSPRLAVDFPGRVYLAAQHLYRGDDARRLHRLKQLAERAGVPLVATNDVLYHEPERRRASGCGELHPRRLHAGRSRVSR